MYNRNVNKYVNNFFELVKDSEDLTPRQVRLLENVSISGIYGGDIVLETENEEIRYLLESQVYDVILDILKKTYTSSITSFFVKIKPGGKKINKEGDVESSVSPSVYEVVNFPKKEPKEKTKNDYLVEGEENIDPTKTFESFVPGKSNTLAYSAAVAVSENPGKSIYNPLYIYGSPGLGKTHLLYSIANATKLIKPDFKIFYTSAESFLTEFVDASMKNKVSDFQKKYRSLDILLIDDIQFFGEGRDKTADVFFHIFNDLISKKKQVVIAADVAPDDLKGLNKRMSQRFKGSVYWGIDAPDYETRVSFVKHFTNEKKFQYNNGEKIIFSDYIVQKLCNFVNDSIRELEGIIFNIVSYCSINNETLSERVLDIILKDFIINNQKEINVIKITKACAEYFGITDKEIKDKIRTPKIARARAYAMYLSRKMTDMTLVQISSFFNKDHTTVIHAEKKIKKEIKEKKEVEEQLEEILKKIK